MIQIHINSEKEIKSIRIVDVTEKVIQEIRYFSAEIDNSTFDKGSYVI